MLTVGLTGSSGSGKGYVCGIFKEKGIPCLDTDKVCREVYKKGHKCYYDLVGAFGEGILGQDGEIDRKVLFELTFSDSEKYSLLNSIAFTHILKETKRWLALTEEQGNEIAVVDAPMLYESGFNSLCDKTVCVIADRPTQISRIVKRDGISEEAAVLRLDKQKKNLYYTSRANYTLDNSAANELKIYTDTSRLIGVLRRFARRRKNKK